MLAHDAHSRHVNKEKILTVFRHCDRNRDGLLDHGDLSTLIKALDSDSIWTEDMIDLVMKCVNVSNDGYISFEEFVNWTYADSIESDTGDQAFRNVIDSIPPLTREQSDQIIAEAEIVVDGVAERQYLEFRARSLTDSEVIQVCLAVMHLQAGVNPNIELDERGRVKHLTWNGAQKMMRNMKIFRACLKEFKDSVETGKLHIQNVIAARAIKDQMGTSFTKEGMAKKGIVPVSLCLWANAALQYHKTMAAGFPDGRMWTCRQRLVFPGLKPGVRYNLPLFLHHQDTGGVGGVLLTDSQGQELKCSEDPVYEAIDHRLLWLDYEVAAPEEQATTYLFHSPMPTTCLRPLRPQNVPEFWAWLTAGTPQFRQNSGQYYHEVSLGKNFSVPRVGWLSEKFQAGPDNKHGVGDDTEGWAADGSKHKCWHGTATDVHWPREWREGDVIGCAIDLDAGEMAFSLNGAWVEDAKIEFKTDGRGIFPAVSMIGMFNLHIARDSWIHFPPRVKPTFEDSEDGAESGMPAATSYKPWANVTDCMRPVPAEPLVEQPLLLHKPEQVLLIADFFSVDKEAVLGRWNLHDDSASMEHRISIETSESFEHVGFGGRRPEGGVLQLDTTSGCLALYRCPSRSMKRHPCDRLHLRVHFFDHGESHSAAGHWIGAKTRLGTGAIGIAFGIDDCYCYVNGACPQGQRKEYSSWRRSFVDRSVGWHLFEILWVESKVCFLIDGESVSGDAAEALHDAEEAVWLVSRCGGNGYWAGLELFHSPLGHGTWELGVQKVHAGDRLPWQTHVQHHGIWTLHPSSSSEGRNLVKQVAFSRGMVVQVTKDLKALMACFEAVAPKFVYRVAMSRALGEIFNVFEVLADGMFVLQSLDGCSNSAFMGTSRSDLADGSKVAWFFPPLALKILSLGESKIASCVEDVAPSIDTDKIMAMHAARRGNKSDTRGCIVDPPQTDTAVLARNSTEAAAEEHEIECRAEENESEAERAERAMTMFVDGLRSRGVVIPSNIGLMEKCREGRHVGCLIYSFGTRRIHITTRVTDEGNILLQVRVGGGFVDFAAFARRHGALEEKKLLASAGRGMSRTSPARWRSSRS